MNSKERLLSAIKIKPLDRVPISTYELNGWNFTSFENTEPSYGKLMNVIREKTDCLYMAYVKLINVYEEKKSLYKNKIRRQKYFY